MAYSVITPFVSLEQPTLAKWNAILANQVAFNDGTGLPSNGGSKFYLATQETTTSASYVRLTTTTDEVTVTVGSTGKVWLTAKCLTSNTGAAINIMGISVSGANTISAATNAAAGWESQEDIRAISVSLTMTTGGLFTGLTPGVTKFSMNYATTAGTAAFSKRFISAVPL